MLTTSDEARSSASSTTWNVRRIQIRPEPGRRRRRRCARRSGHQSPMTSRTATEMIGSMEIFRVVDGRITGSGTVATNRGVRVDSPVLDGSASICWPGPGRRPGDLDGPEARRGRELGFGTAFISERWRRQGRSSLTGAACAVYRPDTDRPAAAKSTTPATTDHRFVGHHQPPALRRAIHPRYRAWYRRHLLPRSASRGHHRADGELRPRHAPAGGGADHLQPRRSVVPDPVSGSDFPGGHQAGVGRSAPTRSGSVAAPSTTSSCTPTSPGNAAAL